MYGYIPKLWIRKWALQSWKALREPSVTVSGEEMVFLTPSLNPQDITDSGGIRMMLLMQLEAEPIFSLISFEGVGELDLTPVSTSMPSTMIFCKSSLFRKNPLSKSHQEISTDPRFKASRLKGNLLPQEQSRWTDYQLQPIPLTGVGKTHHMHHELVSLSLVYIYIYIYMGNAEPSD